MKAKAKTKPAKKEKLTRQMMPENPRDPESGKKLTRQMMPENPDKPPDWEKKN